MSSVFENMDESSKYIRITKLILYVKPLVCTRTFEIIRHVIETQ